ncbi:8414_t:CDS:1, partial [Gigaspora rosea]
PEKKVGVSDKKNQYPKKKFQKSIPTKNDDENRTLSPKTTSSEN